MRFLATYQPIKKGYAYYRVVSADSLNEANKIAERWCNKGFRLLSLIQKELAE